MKKTSAVLCGIQTLALATSLTAATSSAWADTTTASGVTNVTTEQVKPSLMDQLSEKAQLKFVSYFNGPSLTDPGNSISPQYQSASNDFDNTSRANFDNFILTGYKIPKSNWLIGAGEEVKVFLGSNDPYLGNVSAKAPHAADQVAIASPFLRLANSKVYTNGGLTIGGDIFRAYIPVAYDLRDAGIATILRSDWVTTYDIPKTKIELGAYFSERVYFHNDGLKSDPTMSTGSTMTRTVGSLFGSYQLTDPLALSIWTDWIDARNHNSTASRGVNFLDFDNMQAGNAADIEPGISWDVTKKINLSPYIQIYPGHPTLDAMYIGLITAIKIL